MQAHSDLGASVAELLDRVLKEIRYGSVEIIIHDSRVVQIERKEKIRFEPARL